MHIRTKVGAILTACVLLIAGLAWAGVNGEGLHSIEGDQVFHTGGQPGNKLIFTVVSGVTDDTGTERAALNGVTCVDTLVFDEAGASGDEFTAATCATDVSDSAIAIDVVN